jgi:hypothetical protein
MRKKSFAELKMNIAVSKEKSPSSRVTCISCEAEMKQAKQDLDVQESNARRVDDQFADAKWKVSDMKAKWERAKTEERAQSAVVKENGVQDIKQKSTASGSVFFLLLNLKALVA